MRLLFGIRNESKNLVVGAAFWFGARRMGFKRCREMNAEKNEWTVLVKGIGVKPFFVAGVYIWL